MKVHLLDGTYELFRHHFGANRPGAPPTDGDDPVAATRGVLWSVVNLLDEGVTHLGVATDHIIESFRNDLWPGYKTSAGMPPELLSQFPLLEDALGALGVVVWPMVELEADDALAAAAATAAADAAVEQIIIMTPDKDLAQCVRDDRVVQLNRRSGAVSDADGVFVHYGVWPESIPDWLALVGDSADGFPGLPGWGKQSASTVLARYMHIEDIPVNPRTWDVDVRGRDKLGATLSAGLELAYLFRDLATLRADAPVLKRVEELRWRGPGLELAAMGERLRAPRLAERAATLAGQRSS
ncbi:MAG TPA: 5'-3' exonuclease H3TH domain-containing protein [Acidimicrobiales bacterium]|nr:5'-3' exonuclease H3TH domain-containing protein [Acidimicrobiales bacterium]